MASVHKRRWCHNGQGREAWTVRYFDPTGARRSKQFDLKKDADAFRRKVERELEDGTHVAPSESLTVRQVSERFIIDAERRQERGEVGELYLMRLRRWLRLHILPVIGGCKFRDLHATDIDDLFHVLTRKMSPHGARSVVGLVAAMERFGNRHRYVLTNQVAAALDAVRVGAAPRIREFTVGDVGRLLRASLEKRPQRKLRWSAQFACLIHLSACAGLRIGELLALPWSMVDLERGVIRVRHSLSGLMEIKGPKSAAGNRDVPVPQHAIEMLRQWRTVYARPNEWDLVFTNTRGGKLYSRNIHRAWRDLLEDAGLLDGGEVHHFHALRHFAGSWWLHNGLPIADTSKLLGHASPAITMQIYAHAISTPDDRHQAVLSMGQRLLAMPDATRTQIAA